MILEQICKSCHPVASWRFRSFGARIYYVALLCLAIFGTILATDDAQKGDGESRHKSPRSTKLLFPRTARSNRIESYENAGNRLVYCGAKTDMVFLIDSSTNVEKAHFPGLLEFVNGMMGNADINSGRVRIGLLTFGSEARIQFHLNKFKKINLIEGAIRTLTPVGGAPDAVQALRSAQHGMFKSAHGDRSDAPNVVVMVTSGMPDLSSDPMVLESLDRSRIQLFVVGIGLDERRKQELTAAVRGLNPEDLFVVRSYGDLNREDIRDGAYRSVCQNVVGRIGKKSTAGPIPTKAVFIKPTKVTSKPTKVPATKGVPTQAWETKKATTPYNEPVRSTNPRVPLTLTNFTCRGRGLDLVFLLDTSGSIGPANFYSLVQFLVNLTSYLDIDDDKYRVALVTFSDSERIEFDLRNRTRQEVLDRIASVRYSYGSTNIYSALRRMRTGIFSGEASGDRPDVPNVGILLTDGMSNVNVERTLPEAHLVRSSGITMIGVGINIPDRNELENIVSEPRSKYAMTLNGFDGLEGVQPTLLNLLCHGKDRCRENPCRNGANCSSVMDEYSCSCATGYTGKQCQRSCRNKIDLVFALDSSGSVGEENFERMKSFLKKFLREVNTESCQMRIGVVKFGSSAFVQFYLDAYSSTDQLMQAFDGVQYSFGYTYTADAIRAARESVFVTRRGDRPDARNVVVMFTHSSPNVRPSQTPEEIRKARNAGIVVIPVAIGLENKEELEELSTDGSGGLYVENFLNLDKLIKPLADIVLEDADQCSPNPCSNGATCEDQINNFLCRCAVGYSGKRCERRCRSESDIVFLVDTTSNMGSNNVAAVKKFLHSLADRLAFSNDETRIGLMTFSGHPAVKRFLNEPATRDDIIGAIDSLQYDGGYPSTAAALDMMTSLVFQASNGDRDWVRNYAVLITAGQLFSEFQIPRKKRHRHHFGGVHVFGIGIGLQEGDLRQMNEVVADPESDVFTADNPDRLNGILDRLSKVICEDSDQCARARCGNGGTCVDGVNNYTCHCAVGFAGRKCQTSCQHKADVVFLLDSSGSVGRNNFFRLLEFVSSVIEELNVHPDHTRVAVVTFSSTAKISFYLDSFQTFDDVQRALYGISYVYGESNMADGLRTAREAIFIAKHGDRPGARNFIVLVTDGLSNVKPLQAVKEASKCHDAGIHVMSVGIRLNSTEELKGVASSPRNENIFLIDDYEELNYLAPKLAEAVCDDNDHCRVNPCQNNGTCSNVVRSYVCRCVDGYSGRHCESDFNATIDLVFVVESSPGVGRENFEKVLLFIGDTVDLLPVTSRMSRVAVVTYSGVADVRMYLNSFLDKSALLQRIHSLEYGSFGSTDDAEAFKLVRQVVFDPYRGDRPGVANAMVLITDGLASGNRTIEEARKMRGSGVHIYAIGVKLNSTSEMDEVVSRTPENLFLADSYDQISAISGLLLRKMVKLKPEKSLMTTAKHHTTSRTSVKTPEQIYTKATTVTLATKKRTTGPLVTSTASPSTMTTDQSESGVCDRKLDIVLMFDTSGSGITQAQFKRYVIDDFFVRFVNQFQISDDGVYLGAFSFSKNVHVAFHLKDYKSGAGILGQGVKKIRHRTGERSIAKAMQAVHETMFSVGNGDRPGHTNVALLITDSLNPPDRSAFEREDLVNRKRGISTFLVTVARPQRTETARHREFAVDGISRLRDVIEPLRIAICREGR